MNEQVSKLSNGEGNTNLPRKRARRWCFTLNNYTDEEYEQVSTTFSKNKFYIIGKEIGKEGTPHLQGYVEFTNEKSLIGLKKINDRIHWEIAKGSKADNIKYCSKEGNVEKSINIKKDYADEGLKHGMDKRIAEFNKKWNCSIDKDFLDAYCNFKHTRH